MRNTKIYFLALILLIGIFTPIVGQNVEVKDSLDIRKTQYSKPYNAITSNPFTVPKGSLVYQNLFIGINVLEYGISDKLSISTGFFPGLASIKYNFYNNEDFSFSFSNLNIIIPSSNEFIWTPILYLHGALKENEDEFYTFGGGVFFVDGPKALFTFGYHKRLNNEVGFMIDLWLPNIDLDTGIFGGFLPIPAIGLRFYTKSGASFDVGFPFIGMRIPLKK